MSCRFVFMLANPPRHHQQSTERTGTRRGRENTKIPTVPSSSSSPLSSFADCADVPLTTSSRATPGYIFVYSRHLTVKLHYIQLASSFSVWNTSAIPSTCRSDAKSWYWWSEYFPSTACIQWTEYFMIENVCTLPVGDTVNASIWLLLTKSIRRWKKQNQTKKHLWLSALLVELQNTIKNSIQKTVNALHSIIEIILFIYLNLWFQ